MSKKVSSKALVALKQHAAGSVSKKAVKKIARKTVATAPAAGAPYKPSSHKPKPGKMVYYFGKTMCEGDGGMKMLLGGKGANLAEMTSIGLPVPPGFTITTDTCAAYYKNGEQLPYGLMNEVNKNIAMLEKELGKKFGSNDNPLLVSVRSGAAVSMPGMMNTILNLGLTDAAVTGLANATNNVRFAYDAYRRLIDMFGDVVMGVDHKLFDDELSKIKAKYEAKLDTDVPAEGMIEVCEAYKAVYQRHVGEVFPQNPFKQLELAIQAVFKSWNGDKAVKYRRIENVRGLSGTAVNVQSMVYGNMGSDSGTGVAFTRNNATGENEFYGEFLINAQGEDVVAGIRTPQSVSEMPKWNKKVYNQLIDIKHKLERHYRDMQDIEFTIERGTLYMLQTRTGKRNGISAVRIACDMVKEKLIDEKTAILRIPAGDLTQLLLPSFDPAAKKRTEVLTRGIPASPGAAVGKPAFSADEAVRRAHKGERVILVRSETSPEDVEGMHMAAGILTSTGGRTSHAAVVACGWGKCCVVGAGELIIDEHKGILKVGGQTFGREDSISIDGFTGEVMSGEVTRRVPDKISGDFLQVMKWSDKFRRLQVRTNADTPEDAQRAREFGAEGIGLTRTEHMFFEGDRIKAMREMILAETQEARIKALDKLLPYQRDDFVGIFKAMKGLPVTIRLIDPPLHEFLPQEDDAVAEMAKMLKVPAEKVRQRVHQLHEMNPMLGHRGCRLCITYPEILAMQVRAIVEATIDCLRSNIKALPEIMIPLVGTKKELAVLRAEVEATIAQVRNEQEFKNRLDIKIGTMIEIPRAAVTANEIAEAADFFSFGTNDLTQMTFGFSRDDINTFLPDYLRRDLLPHDPFQSIDIGGVGQLVEMGTTRGRATKADLKVGVCGEHGGDPKSVHFFHAAGLDYVSCSPFRVPIARLAAAQAAVMEDRAAHSHD
ncbi:MAG: Pyruvate, phosphate dikinase [Phycisphaerales bacterium]|nr:Pyruvate, phosphate dikinase [Phycisphaerales bacterium]